MTTMTEQEAIRVLRNELAIIIGCDDGRSAQEKAGAAIAWIDKHDRRATIPPVAAPEPDAWMHNNLKTCTTAASKHWMENAGFGVWAEVAASYTIPLYTAAPLLRQEEQPAQAAPDDVRDALRYRGWRDAMIAHDSRIFDVVQSALPADVGDSRDPTAAEWDAAIDAYLRTCAATPADSQKGEGDGA